MTKETMPVTLRELLGCGTRLGITHVEETPGIFQSVRRVLIAPRRGEAGTLEPPLPQTVVIVPPAAPCGGRDDGRGWRLSPFFCPEIAGVAVSEMQHMPDYLRRFSKATGMPVFASRFDASLLNSRLVGLIREKSERAATVHGVLVEFSGMGILIMGASGIGKTACGLDLITRGGRWIADDAVVLQGRGDILYGRGHERTRQFIAVRGRGLIRAESLLGAENLREETRVGVIIRFAAETEQRRLLAEGLNPPVCDIVGVTLPSRCLAAGGCPSRMAGQVTEVVREILA
ncbi:MAG: hypothetical protein ACYDAA_07950 [Syntrophales bacterium]